MKSTVKMTILGVEFSGKFACQRACFCLWSLNTLFRSTWRVKVMEIIQTHPVVNKWGQGTAGECGFGAVTELNKTNPVSQQSFFSICTVCDGGRGWGESG